MAALLHLCLLAAMVAKPVAPTTTTQSPYIVVEDNGDTMNDTSIPSTDRELLDLDLNDTSMNGCRDTFANHGLNFSSFWFGAAHGIHSLYLEEIREYFEPGAPVQNKIPVVNANLSAEQTILFNAPMAGYNKNFKTMALKLISYYMLHDQPDFAIHGLNTLEKLGHQYHMHEVWAAAVPIYQKMKQNPIEDPKLCPCVNDITGNGILTRLVKIAEQLKYFNYKRQPRARWDMNYYGYNTTQHNTTQHNTTQHNTTTYRPPYRGKRSTENDATPELIAEYERKYLAESSKENAKMLLDLQLWKPNSLVGPDQWITFEAMLTSSMLDEDKLNDFATFMYCKLNQPDLDHPKDLFD